LTPSQIKVLELRTKGYTQKEVADILGTTRANISITERRAKENVEKARRTIEVFERIGAPLKVDIEAGKDLFDVPKEVFSKASKSGIKVKEDSLSLIEKIREEVDQKVRGRNIREKIEIVVLKDGRVMIR
jgi:hypothetical protein